MSLSVILTLQKMATSRYALRLSISQRLSNHISNVMQKLNVKGRSQAVVELIRLGELHI
ncbi:LuxR C-terminal-related transcriptional regulator [Paenibacillus sp. GXUN7292]|uniref:LuxR C-terminal-related transcriptional regulator n=1 Tax=Paenibacillus sp. GXUN7292 TaxID=3422499 RepID=UPI003D7E4666